MAKIKNFSVLILLVLTVLCSFSQSSSLRDRVEQTYLSQLGVRELTGQNDGDSVEMYLQSTGLPKGYAWCAAFVNWVYIQNEIQTVNSPAWSPSWFTQNVIYKPSEYILNAYPNKGDVFGIYFNKKGRVAHVGLIHRWPDGNITITVEGNTNEAGSREGDGVYKKRRLKRQIYIVSSYIK
ncbi:MAG: CHAP domain-containing protein [Bacteroidales bacterium]|nr:CHAP domain-containing protein [Bacteroidales bacterium]